GPSPSRAEMTDARARRRSWVVRRERGSVTAEFAITLPAVALVLAASIMCVQLGGLQLRLQDAAGAAARSLARGEARPQALSAVTALVPGASVTTRVGAGAGVVCVTAAK